MTRGEYFLPVSRDEMIDRGWYYYDFLVVTADGYIDHPSFGSTLIARLLEAEGYAPARYEAWLVVSLGRNRTILESGPDTGEWPDARDRITRIRGGKLTVSDDYGRLSRELEAITADYEAGPDAYAENKAASDEMLREACRVEWIG